MTIRRSLGVLLAAASLAASGAWAADVPGGDFGRLSSQYAGWAGGKTNADNLIGGLRSGSSITLVTNTPGGSVSLAGFTPSAPMTYGQVSSTLANARESLKRIGIVHPTAEQIQAALIGGEVEVASGASRQLAGLIVPRG